MVRSEFKANDTVRVLRIEDENHPDAYARVAGTYDDGRVWIANLNMPYMGTISEIVDPSEIEKVEKMEKFKFESGDQVKLIETGESGVIQLTLADGRVYFRGETKGYVQPEEVELVRRITAENITPAEYYDALERFDWYYDFSDDGSVWRAGEKRKAELIHMSTKSPVYRALWDGFREYHFSGEPWGTDKAEKPVRP